MPCEGQSRIERSTPLGPARQFRRIFPRTTPIQALRVLVVIVVGRNMSDLASCGTSLKFRGDYDGQARTMQDVLGDL